MLERSDSSIRNKKTKNHGASGGEYGLNGYKMDKSKNAFHMRLK